MYVCRLESCCGRLLSPPKLLRLAVDVEGWLMASVPRVVLDAFDKASKRASENGASKSSMNRGLRTELGGRWKLPSSILGMGILRSGFREAIVNMAGGYPLLGFS